jgi:hypothetical protein
MEIIIRADKKRRAWGEDHRKRETQNPRQYTLGPIGRL